MPARAGAARSEGERAPADASARPPRRQRGTEGRSEMTRKVLWPILVVGVVLIVAPFALSMQTKAPAGQRMMDDFNPLMQPANVQTTADYYYDVFVPLGNVVPLMPKENVAKFQDYVDGFAGMQADAAKP